MIAISRRILLCGTVLMHLVSTSSYGQNEGMVITGAIFSQQDSTSMAYTHIAYDNGSRGSVSNEDGVFQISIGHYHRSDTLTFSHIGYEDFTIPISEMDESQSVVIYLFPSTNVIPNISITGINEYKLVRGALENIQEYFVKDDHILKGFYREYVRHVGLEELIYFGEGSIQAYKKGYKNALTTHKRRKKLDGHVVIDSGFVAKDRAGFVYNNIRFGVPPIVNGPLMPVSLDILTVASFQLKDESLLDTKLTYKGSISDGNREIYLIDFEPAEDREFGFKGTLYYDRGYQIITKVVYEYSKLGLERYNMKKPRMNLLSRKFSITYGDKGGRLAISFLTVENIYEHTSLGHLIENKMEYVTTECVTENVNPFKRRKRVKRGMNFKEGLLKKGLSEWSGISIIPRTRQMQALVYDRPVPVMTMKKEEIKVNKYIQYISYEEAVKNSKKVEKPVLVLFSADWCPPCKEMKINVLNDPEVVDLINLNFWPVYADIDYGAGKRIAKRFGVQSVPTIIFITSN